MTRQKQPVQLDLFGDIEQQLDRESVLAAARAEWQAGFERADWVAPYDCGHGPEGTVVAGWRCPDPECGEVADNAYTLARNHGFDPDVPGLQPYYGRCQKLAMALQDRAVRAYEAGPCPVCGGTRTHYTASYPERPCLVPAHAQRVGGEAP
ncbi:MAG: hypothetical protein ACRDQB_08330 [Thermocrispum sp.]